MRNISYLYLRFTRATNFGFKPARKISRKTLGAKNGRPLADTSTFDKRNYYIWTMNHNVDKVTTPTKTRTADIYLDEHNITHIVFVKKVAVDYEDAVDNYLVVKHLTKNKPCVKLIDIRADITFEAKAKKYLDNEEIQNKTKARAVLVGDSVKKVTLNFFTKFNSNSIPTKFFTDYNLAVDWLKKYNVTS